MANCVFIDYLVRRLSQGMYKKVTYIRMRKFKIQKRKYLFILIKVQLITISSASSVIPYISEINSISSSLKKKKGLKREKERGKERKRKYERKGKRDGKEKEKEKGKKEERLKKKEKEKKKRKRKKRRK